VGLGGVSSVDNSACGDGSPEHSILMFVEHPDFVVKQNLLGKP
jgi:hypothetical protein